MGAVSVAVSDEEHDLLQHFEEDPLGEHHEVHPAELAQDLAQAAVTRAVPAK